MPWPACMASIYGSTTLEEDGSWASRAPLAKPRRAPGDRNTPNIATHFSSLENSMETHRQEFRRKDTEEGNPLDLEDPLAR